MNDLQVFKFEDKNVEVIMLDNEPLFNARDIGTCLNMATRTVNDHVQSMSEKQSTLVTNDIVKTCSNSGLTAIRKLNNTGEHFLTERGVYKLIMRSRKRDKDEGETRQILSMLSEHLWGR